MPKARVRRRKAVVPKIAKGPGFTRLEKQRVTKKAGPSKGKVGARSLAAKARAATGTQMSERERTELAKAVGRKRAASAIKKLPSVFRKAKGGTRTVKTRKKK